MSEEKEGNDNKKPKIHVAIVGLLLMLIGFLLVLALSAYNVKPVITGTVVTGVDVFAVLYIEAQFIERIVEPFSEKSPINKDTFGNTKTIDSIKGSLKDEQDKAKVLSDAINRFQVSRPDLKLASLSDQEPTKSLLARKKESDGKIDDLNKELDDQTSRRVYSFWGLTSLMGMVLVYFSTGLFTIVGLSVQDISIAGRTVLSGHGLDAILSGVIVGAGTKPLHDLIGTLQKSSSQKGTATSS